MDMLKRIDKDIILAMRSKDKLRITVLRSLKTAIKYEAIETGAELSEEKILSLFKSQVKSRQQAIELYKQGNRLELVEKEENEIEIISEYLPVPLTEAEMINATKRVISELGATAMKDMGEVMKTLKTELGSRADGKILSNIVRKELS
ncbi:MAG: GatB/YqeY domain-containing protein [Candidatus Cloacimonetes bacterium]|nr:GatB/YqeY domain-containing protein [Candidatus Cloacimonadota bacterium]